MNESEDTDDESVDQSDDDDRRGPPEHANGAQKSGRWRFLLQRLSVSICDGPRSGPLLKIANASYLNGLIMLLSNTALFSDLVLTIGTHARLCFPIRCEDSHIGFGHR